MSYNLDIDECLKDKHNYTFELQENSVLHSALLENLVAEILLFFSIKFDSSNIYKKLNGLIISINRWCVPKFNARLLFLLQYKTEITEENQSDNDDEINDRTNSIGLDYSNGNLQTSNKLNFTKRVPDILNLSTVNKLKLFCFLIDAQLACAHDANQLDESFSDEQQRIIPIAIDAAGRKFWYFGDTWLFLEDGNLFNAEEEEEKVKDLLDNAENSLKQLIERGITTSNKRNRKRNTKGRFDKKCPKSVNKPKCTFNQHVLDEANRNLCTSSSFRVICKDSNHLSNLINAYKAQKDFKQNENFINKLEQCLQSIQTIEKESREQRLLQRQQRIQEQMEKKELIDAGIILPSSHSSCRDDLSSLGSSTEENDYKESNKPAKKIPRLPAYDWWSPVTSSSFDGSNDAEIFRTLFKRKSSDKRRSNLLGRSLLTNDRRISLIASPSSTTTKLSLSRSTQPFLTEDAITSRNCSSSKTSFLNSNKSLNPQRPRPPQKGSLALTGHHLIFSPEKTHWHPRAVEESGENCIEKSGGDSQRIEEQEFWLLHRAVDRVLVEHVNRNPNARQGAYLRLKCKNFLHICFELDDLLDCQLVARSIETLSNLNDIGHNYPFYYRCPFTVLDDGWKSYVLEDKFSKLQLLTGERFRISSVNNDFEACSSYPEQVIVPKGIGDDYLRISATFRSGGRFPVLSYYHQKTKSTIYRCGQPLIGPTSRRCKEDEIILNSMLSKFSQGLIYDTRSKLIAQTSRGRACIENSVSFLSRLANCGWLQYITDTLTGAATIAQVVHCMDEVSEVPVLVHGGDGIDSTLLVTSLARLILDPDARTIRGFQSLIEDEWTGAGHPFSIRCAHAAFATGTITGPSESPVFLCFLDCVWQLMRQYISCLEFNEQFLIFLFEHAYASEFGTFLGNNEQEKRNFNVKTHTVSLWSYVNHPAVLPIFLNCLYRPYDQPIWPSVAPQSIILWERIYLRWQRNWFQSDRSLQTLNSWKQEEKRLITRLQVLQQQQNEQSRSISACSTITSTEAAHNSNSFHSHLIENEAKIILPHNPFALENLVKMDHLNITSFDNQMDGEGFEVVEDTSNHDGSKRMAKSTANSSTASMLNGAKQTARQFLQKLGPSFI
ncbi:Myotubularin phosphatase domain-containing protein [Meloidogyne graminicola]|uniref:Myotubularin phosphatase domain-containing protein n=1 Tax=Meloidogyne graminicola TaxID=189291 RepID=A0A8S9ZHG1_9BILA|nr:Myotubularin phosphatase domain-containing protein [Meloidogyne graminicola]